MPKNYSTEDYDVIYLQTEEFPETTWCVDQINDDDVKYLRATAKRAAADEMYETLKVAAEYYEMLEAATGVEHPVLKEIRATLSLAEKETKHES